MTTEQPGFCGDCQFCHPILDEACGDPPRYGRCRRFPPVWTAHGSGARWDFPRVEMKTCRCWMFARNDGTPNEAEPEWMS
jgi:hypothetical protein